MKQNYDGMISGILYITLPFFFRFACDMDWGAAIMNCVLPYLLIFLYDFHRVTKNR